MLRSHQHSTYFEPWLEFQQPIVRQLAFAVASPNLLLQAPTELQLTHAFELHTNAEWQQHFENYLPRLRQLDQTPAELENFLQQLKSTRLGLRFEYLLYFWLLDQDYHPYQLLGHSIQKIEGAKTRGELDFLLLNQDSKGIEHWEVALKYYLAEGNFLLQQWFGLNRNDTLAKKLRHFTEKQFQFTDALGYNIERRVAVMKGQLYLPYHPNISAINTIAPWINLQRRLGLWGTSIPTQSFYRLQRHEWLCPNATATALPAKWWTDGLYYQPERQQFYMYRHPNLLMPGRSQLNNI